VCIYRERRQARAEFFFCFLLKIICTTLQKTNEAAGRTHSTSAAHGIPEQLTDLLCLQEIHWKNHRQETTLSMVSLLSQLNPIHIITKSGVHFG
jgi:endonuclease/exonuclease/phosphatase family metal-dependent hydrolase